MADPVSAGTLYAVIGTSTAVNVAGQYQQYKGQKKAGEINEAQGKIEDQSRVRQQAREMRRRQAQILQASENLGSVGSSREVGGIANLQQQASANLARMAGQQKAIQGLSKANQDIASGQLTSALGQAVGSVATSLSVGGGSAGGSGGLK